jgi:hypothetical protein
VLLLDASESSDAVRVTLLSEEMDDDEVETGMLDDPTFSACLVLPNNNCDAGSDFAEL